MYFQTAEGFMKYYGFSGKSLIYHKFSCCLRCSPHLSYIAVLGNDTSSFQVTHFPYFCLHFQGTQLHFIIRIGKKDKIL